MRNPSYLIRSRHAIYYFRYPVPISGNASCRVSVSLKTRCPREALRLAKALEYYSGVLIERMDFNLMDHAEIMSIMKSYYAEVLERTKAKIDKEGQLSKEKVDSIVKYLQDLEAVIEEDYDDISEMIGAEYAAPEDDALQQDISKIMQEYDLFFSPDSREYGMMKSAYKHMRRNYFNDLLSYNQSVMEFSLLGTEKGGVRQNNIDYKPQYRLGSVIESYLDEIKYGITDRSHNEQRNCLKYLTDWLGEDYLIGKVDLTQAREVKELLLGTPKGRNKAKLTLGKAIEEQVEIAHKHGLDTLGSKSVNKYLGYFQALFKWAMSNRYIAENPFIGIRVKDIKKKNRREMFRKDEVAKIIERLEEEPLVKNKSNYWGALIAVYTGARRNEIAGLLPDDVKQDDATGIWYFNITDEEEEGKAVKTEASQRIVPIHSSLIELGFLDFVKESRAMQRKIKYDNGYKSRLLYDLTYTQHEKWGRNLGRWFNERYLKALGLKTKKKTLHSLRHSFITFLSVEGVEGANIKSMVGHEPDTVTTQIYMHYGIDHLPVFKEAIEKLRYC